MSLVKKLRRRAIGWLARQMEYERKQIHGEDSCLLGSDSVLMAESEINNLSGNPSQIVVGNNSYIRGRLLTYGHGGKISIGDWCYVGIRTEIWSMDSITIGNRVLISHDVNIHDGTGHSDNPSERHQHFKQIIKKGHPRLASELPGMRSAGVVIEDDVWISFGVSILRGVRIGRGSIISAGSIVTRDVPPGMIYRNEVTPVIVPLTSNSIAQ